MANTDHDNLSSEVRLDGFGRASDISDVEMPGSMSVTKYNLILGGTLLWGFLLNVIFCFAFSGAAERWNPAPIMVAYSVLALVGILMNSWSHNPVISFIGYNLVVLPLGLVLSIIVVQYDLVSVTNAFLAAAAVTLTMMLLSLVFPRLFLSMGAALGVALLAVIAVELILFFVAPSSFHILDVAVALIFCGYIGYDWAIAQNKEKTADHAVDSACALYLDIVHLFIRLLAIFGKSKKK